MSFESWDIFKDFMEQKGEKGVDWLLRVFKTDCELLLTATEWDKLPALPRTPKWMLKWMFKDLQSITLGIDSFLELIPPSKDNYTFTTLEVQWVKSNNQIFLALLDKRGQVMVLSDNVTEVPQRNLIQLTRQSR